MVLFFGGGESKLWCGVLYGSGLVDILDEGVVNCNLGIVGFWDFALDDHQIDGSLRTHGSCDFVESIAVPVNALCNLHGDFFILDFESDISVLLVPLGEFFLEQGAAVLVNHGLDFLLFSDKLSLAASDVGEFDACCFEAELLTWCFHCCWW